MFPIILHPTLPRLHVLYILPLTFCLLIVAGSSEFTFSKPRLHGSFSRLKSFPGNLVTVSVQSFCTPVYNSRIKCKQLSKLHGSPFLNFMFTEYSNDEPEADSLGSLQALQVFCVKSMKQTARSSDYAH